MMNQFYHAFTKINSILINPLSSQKRATKRLLSKFFHQGRRDGLIILDSRSNYLNLFPGQNGGYFVYNHTYKSTQNGKNYDVVEQLLDGLKNQGKQAVMDRGFLMIRLLSDAKEIWETRIICIQG